MNEESTIKVIVIQDELVKDEAYRQEVEALAKNASLAGVTVIIRSKTEKDEEIFYNKGNLSKFRKKLQNTIAGDKILFANQSECTIKLNELKINKLNKQEFRLIGKEAIALEENETLTSITSLKKLQEFNASITEKLVTHQTHLYIVEEVKKINRKSMYDNPKPPRDLPPPPKLGCCPNGPGAFFGGFSVGSLLGGVSYGLTLFSPVAAHLYNNAETTLTPVVKGLLNSVGVTADDQTITTAVKIGLPVAISFTTGIVTGIANHLRTNSNCNKPSPENDKLINDTINVYNV